MANRIPACYTFRFFPIREFLVEFKTRSTQQTFITIDGHHIMPRFEFLLDGVGEGEALCRFQTDGLYLLRTDLNGTCRSSDGGCDRILGSNGHAFIISNDPV